MFKIYLCIKYDYDYALAYDIQITRTKTQGEATNSNKNQGGCSKYLKPSPDLLGPFQQRGGGDFRD